MDSSKVTKQIKLNGNIRDAAWMTRQFQKGRIRFDNSNGNEITDVLNETLFNQFKTAIRVVNEVYDSQLEISLKSALEINRAYEIGDTIREEVTPKDFGRIAAQTAKQVIMQRVRKEEREVIYKKGNRLN